ncbi:MAG: hypothetical protein LUQ13_01385 [Methanomicrobiales archaeon]|nr:hypothetical protein [Methanomicrobiales archaeon]
MSSGILLLLLFFSTSILTIWLILRHPILRVRIHNRDITFQSYFLGALLGPVIILASGVVTVGAAVNGISGTGGSSPLGILILFLSMVFISIYLDVTGFFEYCARTALRFAGRDGVRLFFALYGTVSVLTIFTSNDIIVLTFTPFIYYFARNAGINPKPYLIAEFFAANTWSMMLYIGNPTNILLASAFGLLFDGYLRWMLLPTLAAGMVSAILLYRIFTKDIQHTLPADNIDPASAITDRTGSAIGVLFMSGCILALALAPYFKIDLWVVALTFALVLILLLVLRDVWSGVRKRSVLCTRTFAIATTARRMPWTIVPFVLSLFITVEALRIAGITGDVGRILAGWGGGSVVADTWIFGILSALAANLLNNIPMTVAFIPIISVYGGDNLQAAVLATTIGSNLGANITPLGSLAGIMWMNILRTRDVRITFGEFVSYGLCVTPLTLAAALGVLAVEFIFW